ncbi:cob(I)yrinic acid a,c-diamide adenosyltransferase [Flammeovirga sp. EKP202]|uniref:cob(I)yrinic acid a,c-diamide adenosyltransferase n=1 Tax=Flammeovirga sp. EKP202 TaxID=2770592 RepID=UPI00165EEB29|nr:cob(I)yrinic acid a,c-diamide adenosyltransferase [Flammeovirga sp. EKP202]MBD0404817.1 cob(I)yrinic acid a,c-diamide adenosyltransferase [Flammeovirga sp. EKP202]
MKVYTKTGDKGETSLFGGKRVKKSHPRIEAYGTIDELNSYVGLIRDQDVNIPRSTVLKEIQDRLFTIGAELAADPDKPQLKKPDLLESDIEYLENAIDEMEEDLQPLKYFVLPGGHTSVSFCHLGRTVCRRAERLAIALDEEDGLSDYIIVRYLNRLSDYLFVLSRKMAADLKVDENYWIPRK